MVKSVRITPDGKVEEVSGKQEKKEQEGRLWDGSSLHVPEHWEFRKFRLTMTYPDIFGEADDLNPLATLLFRKLKHPRGTPDDVICGAVYLSNETSDKLIDFTMKDLHYIMSKIL